jgi:hypothetical protein
MSIYNIFQMKSMKVNYKMQRIQTPIDHFHICHIPNLNPSSNKVSIVSRIVIPSTTPRRDAVESRPERAAIRRSGERLRYGYPSDGPGNGPRQLMDGADQMERESSAVRLLATQPTAES